MQSVNWWLMALAFVLGLVLTLALMIRRVKREVPEYATLAAGAGAGAAGAAGAAKLAGGGAGAVEDEPYGAGSIRVKATATAPDGGYTIKGNEDSMLYHTTESPSYKQTIAEVWFRDVKSAERAGFSRWDKGGGAATAAGAAAAGAAGGVAAAKFAGGEADDDAATTRAPKIDADAEDDAATLRAPKIDAGAEDTAAKPGAVAAGAAAAGGAAAAKFADTSTAETAKMPAVTEEPHGPGSAKPGADGSGPEGWTVKGNEDSKLYHSPESPAYNVTVAEVWFRDAETAENAGFNRWDSGKSQRGTP